jgi:TrmH family RNA methyltransferase
MPLITSRKNPRLKAAVELRESRERRRTNQFLIDGARETLRAIRSGIAIETLFICREWCSSPDAAEILKIIADHGNTFHAEVLDVAADVFPMLAFGDRSDGIVAVAVTPRRSLAELKLSAQPLIGVIAGIEKPGNVGAVLRSADGAGLDALIVAGGNTDLYNPNTIRASLGTIFAIPVVSESEAETLAWLRSQKLSIAAAILVEGAREYTSVDLSPATAIILGSEAEGLGPLWRSQPDIQQIMIPMRGIADSLNISNAAAVLFYEALRQRSNR